MKVFLKRVGKWLLKLLVNIGMIILSIPMVFVVIPVYAIVRKLASVIFKKTLPPISISNQDSLFSPIFNKLFGTKTKAQANRTFIYFLIPALGAFIIFVIVPFFMGIYFSLTNWDGINNASLTFVGFDNYKNVFADSRFIYSFMRTSLYSILNIIIINVVAFFLALLVTQKLKLKNIYRAGFFMPNLVGGLILGYIWKFIFNNAVPAIFAPGTAVTRTLITNPDTAMAALMVVVTWQYAGYIMMIYIAALQNVPVDLIEASKIDGASGIQRLRHITMPLVTQAFTVSLFLTLVTSFKQFDTVLALTNGGPSTLMPEWLSNWFNLPFAPNVKSLNFIAYNIWDSAYNMNKLGQGQAKAIVFFLLLLVFSIAQVNYTKKREVEM